VRAPRSSLTGSSIHQFILYLTRHNAFLVEHPARRPRLWTLSRIHPFRGHVTTYLCIAYHCLLSSQHTSFECNSNVLNELFSIHPLPPCAANIVAAFFPSLLHFIECMFIQELRLSLGLDNSLPFVEFPSFCIRGSLEQMSRYFIPEPSRL
jgi:hypothetical protein